MLSSQVQRTDFAYAAPTSSLTSSLKQTASASETFVYIPDFQLAGIAQYRINKGGGLVPLKPARALPGRVISQIVVNKAGHFAYTVGKGGFISHARINADGTLSKRNVPDVKIEDMGEQITMMLDEPNRTAYVNLGKNGRIERLSIGPEGILKPLAPLTVTGAGRSFSFLNAKHDALYIGYVLQKDDEATRLLKHGVQNHIPIHFDAFRLNGTDMPVFTDSIVSDMGMLTLHPTEPFAFISGDNVISSYRITAKGTFSLIGSAKIPNKDGLVGLIFAPHGNAVYITHQDKSNHFMLSQFQITDDGRLVPLSPQDISIEGDYVNDNPDPTGRFLYVTSVHNDQTLNRFVVTFRLGEDGTLQRVTKERTETGNNAGLPEIDPTGRYAYVSTMVFEPVQKNRPRQEYNDVLQFKVQADGQLKPLSVPKVRMNYFWNMVFLQKNITIKPVRQR